MKRILVPSGSPLEAAIGFSRAVRIGPYVAVAGTAPLDEHAVTVGVGSVYEQTARCLAIVRTALASAGVGLGDVIRTRIMLIDISRWEDAARAR